MMKFHDRRELDMTYEGGGYDEKPKPSAITEFVTSMLEGFFPRETFYSNAVKGFEAASRFMKSQEHQQSKEQAQSRYIPD